MGQEFLHGSSMCKGPPWETITFGELPKALALRGQSPG